MSVNAWQPALPVLLIALSCSPDHGRVSVASDDVVGPEIDVLSLGYAHVEGWIHRFDAKDPFDPYDDEERTRLTEYVVAQIPMNVTFPNDKVPDSLGAFHSITADRSVTFPTEVHQHAEIIDLVRGYAYVDIYDQPFFELIPPLELQYHVVQNPTRLLPAVLAGIGARARVRQMDELESVATALHHAMERIRTSPALQRALGLPIIGGREPHDPVDPKALSGMWSGFAGEEDMQSLIDQLLPGAPVIDQPLEHYREAMAAYRILELLSLDDEAGKLMSLIHFPFIITRHTTGGAPGTEVVVYTRDVVVASGDPPRCEVYYFYLCTEGAHAVDIVAYHKFSNTVEIVTDEQIHPGCYARLVLESLPFRGGHQWFLDGTIDVHPITGEMDAELIRAVRGAHRDACISAATPTPSIDLQGHPDACSAPPSSTALQLRCPQ